MCDSGNQGKSYQTLNHLITTKYLSSCGTRLKLKKLTISDQALLVGATPTCQGSIIERIYWIRNNIYDYKNCLECDAIIIKFFNGYSDFCSIACHRKSFRTKLRREQTVMEKFGTSNVFQNKDIKNKIESHWQELHGVGNAAKTETVRKKISNGVKQAHHEFGDQIKAAKQITCVERYGVDHQAKRPEHRELMIEKNQEKFGFDFRSQDPEWKNSYKQDMLNKYGVTNAFAANEIKEKIKSTSLERYGVSNPGTTLEARARARETLFTNQGRYFPNQLHIPEDLYGMIQTRDGIKLLFEKYGIYGLSKEFGVVTPWWIYQLRKHQIIQDVPRSFLELEVGNFLSSIGIAYKGNDRTIIKPQEIDFVIEDLKLGIEINGLFWHSELAGKGPLYHLDKTNRCQEQGYTLFQIFEDEWINNRKIVESRILNAIGNTPVSIPARKCKIVNVSVSDSRDFLESNHLQGWVGASNRYGLVFEDELVAMMTFGKPRFSKTFEYELLRYTNKTFTRVIGGASKLLSHFKQECNPSSIISYSDRRWGVGGLYQVLGMTDIGGSKASYFYFNKDMIRHNRIEFQKHKLKDKLLQFDPDLSEWENMQMNGWNRIWDCGNRVFTWLK